MSCPAIPASQVVVLSKRAKKLQQEYDAKGWILVDVAYNSDSPTFVKFSPSYPHGGIPIPFISDKTAESVHTVERLWQGLKVFQNEGVDWKRMKGVSTKSAKGVKRGATEKRGALLGHSYDGKVIGYLEARERIYVPAYRWVLDNRLQNEVALLRGLLEEGRKIALLDYDTNENVGDLSRPLCRQSHAGLVKEYLLERL